MTTHELEQFIERAWKEPLTPTTSIPVELASYAIERARRVRACENRRWLALFANRLRTVFGQPVREAAVPGPC